MTIVKPARKKTSLSVNEDELDVLGNKYGIAPSRPRYTAHIFFGSIGC